MKKFAYLFLALPFFALHAISAQSSDPNGSKSTSNSGAQAAVNINQAAATPTIQALPGVMGSPGPFPAFPMTNGEWKGYFENETLPMESAQLMGHRNHHCQVTILAKSDIPENNGDVSFINWWPEFQSYPGQKILASVDCVGKPREPMQASMGSAIVACKKATHSNRVSVRWREIQVGITKGMSIGGSGGVSPFIQGNPTAFATGGLIGIDKAYTESHSEVQVMCMNDGSSALPENKPAAETSKPTPPAPVQPVPTVQPKVSTLAPTPVVTPQAIAYDELPHFAILFISGNDKVQDIYQPKIKEFATWLSTHQNYRLAVEGFTDRVGTQNYNAALGLRRAENVEKVLITAGVLPDRIEKVLSGGKTPPASTNNSENRRVILQILGPESGK